MYNLKEVIKFQKKAMNSEYNVGFVGVKLKLRSYFPSFSR